MEREDERVVDVELHIQNLHSSVCLGQYHLIKPSF